MSLPALLLTVLELAAFAYPFGKRRSLNVANNVGGIRNLHFLPGYYGLMTAIWCALPALTVVIFWLMFEPSVITQLVVSELPQHIRSLPGARWVVGRSP